MIVEQPLERVYRVRFDEAGPDGTFRSSGFLRFAQDLAWLHSESAGFGREWNSERGLFWLVRGVGLDIVGSIDYGSDVVVSTEVIGFRRVIARRRSEFHVDGSERPVAVALTDWVLLNDAGRPVRPPAEFREVFAANSDFTPLRAATGDAPPDAHERAFRVRRSEADPMAHVNNAGYIDYMDEQYMESLGAADDAPMPLPRRYRVEFVASATPGLGLVGRSWPTDTSWFYRLADENGRELFRATLEADSASWVGG